MGLEQGKTSHHCLEYSQHGEAVSEWCGEGGGLEQGKTSHHCLEYSQHGEAVSEWCGEGGGVRTR